MTNKHAELIKVLRGGRQCDEEGAEIIMSRQACLEAADALQAEIAAVPCNEVKTLRDALHNLKGMCPEGLGIHLVIATALGEI